MSHQAGYVARVQKLAGDVWRRRPALSCAALAAVIASHPAMAQQPDRWVADEALATATLPHPSAGEMASATLSCDAQRWSLVLDTGDVATPQAGSATMTVGSRAFDLDTRLAGKLLTARLPKEALEPLKNGSRLELDLPTAQDEPAAPLVFSLRGSKLAISSAQERCSLRDMSAYQPVTFTPYSSYLNEAKALRAADIEAFVQATASQPKLDVAMAELDEGRRVLFTRLCGSSWYYGLSGCNITGFAPGPADQAEGDEGGGTSEPAWRPVYDTENVLLYLDQRSRSHGWSDVVTLPVGASGTGLVWRWNGRSYALKGELPAEADDFDPQALRQGRD